MPTISKKGSLPRPLLLLLAITITLVGATPMKLSPWGSSLSQVYDTTNQFPLPDHGNFAVHDPNILKHNSEYYLFRGGHHIPIYKATDLNGPWMQIGTVLDSDSVIHVGNRSRPWAPTTIEKNGIFYCFYTVSSHGSRESAIGVATTTTLDGSPWIDHGAVVQSAGSDVWPFNITNTIDASFITDQTTGKFYLNFGSFWHDIWQVPLADNLLSIEDPKNPDAVQLTFIPGQKVRPQEGSFMSYRDGWYYVWFSHGKCCHFYKGFPEKGMEYSIRVGRSRNVRGPFVDKHDRLLVESGGTVVYGSNHGLVYAPGGIGVLSGEGSASDILYYHYLNTTIGFKNKDARLGWNWLKYENGWPVVLAGELASAKVGKFITSVTDNPSVQNNVNAKEKTNAAPTLQLPKWFRHFLTMLMSGWKSFLHTTGTRS